MRVRNRWLQPKNRRISELAWGGYASFIEKITFLRSIGHFEKLCKTGFLRCPIMRVLADNWANIEENQQG